jgi:acyl-lipid omega-6 desaturase (Delta-12 desaturase)
VTTALTPPRPAALRHLHATDAAGVRFIAANSVLTGAGISLSMDGGLTVWAIGQILLALAMVEWFVLLHECGHYTLFRRRLWNIAAGHVAGFFALIPFAAWTHVHRLHHKWTGWQDLDPTTATLAPRERGRFQRGVVRFCWKYWVPMFATVYRAGTFWNPVRLVRYAAESRRAPQLIGGVVAVLAAYAALLVWLGPALMVRSVGLAVVIAFVLEDLLILSQHTHVPMEVSGGGRVAPHSAMEQERFTRSLKLPRIVSRAVLHFDAHELHHMYPFVPGYRLRDIAYEPQNEIGWRQWVVAARRIPGDVLLFQNRRETGFDL